MSDPISVRCPAVPGALTLKNRESQGRKISCPKCGKAFVVPAASVEETDDEWDTEFEADKPAATTPRRLPPLPSGPPAQSRNSLDVHRALRGSSPR